MFVPASLAAGVNLLAPERQELWKGSHNRDQSLSLEEVASFAWVDSTLVIEDVGYDNDRIDAQLTYQLGAVEDFRFEATGSYSAGVANQQALQVAGYDANGSAIFVVGHGDPWQNSTGTYVGQIFSDAGARLGSSDSQNSMPASGTWSATVERVGNVVSISRNDSVFAQTVRSDALVSIDIYFGRYPPQNLFGTETLTSLVIENTTDADLDALPDAWELTYFASIEETSGNADVDGDSLTNAAEYALGTNPTLEDTDGDLFDDGYEAQNEMLPLDAADGDALTAHVFGRLGESAVLQRERGLYTRDSVHLLFPRTVLLSTDASTGDLQINLQLLSSPSPGGPLSPLGDTVEWSTSETADAAFYRIELGVED